MYDTLTLWLDHRDALKSVNALTDVNESIKKATGEVSYWGKLKNLKVMVNCNGLYVNGSLPKYLFGNNLETFSRSATEEVIEALSDRLSLPMKEARVSRLDVAKSFIMKQPVIEYLTQFTEASHYKKWEIANRETLLYKNSMRELTLYDKTAEVKRCRGSIPEVYKHRNVLRYEMRLKSRVAKQLGQERILASLLSDESFYMAIVDKWQKEYFSIHILRKPIGTLDMTTTKALERSLALIGLQCLGETPVLDMIRAATENGELSKMQCHRHRKRARELAEAPRPTDETSEAILELDSKVRHAARTQHRGLLKLRRSEIEMKVTGGVVRR